MLTLLFAVVAKSEENLKHKSKHQISKNINLDINYLNKKNDDCYLIGPGDQMVVSVVDDYPELKTNTRVSGEGTIILPSLGTQYLENFTINELENLLNES